MTQRVENINSLLTVSDLVSEVNALDFAIIQRIRDIIGGMFPCQVTDDPDGDGYISIKPLVSGRTKDGREIPYGKIYRVPVMLLIGGKSEINIPPAKGDIGFASVCSRDISSFKQSNKAGIPPSMRMHNLADSIYIMGYKSAQEVQTTIDMSGGKLKISSKNPIVFDGEVEFKQKVTMDSTLNVSDKITANEVETVDGIGLGTHVHDTPQGKSGPPLAGKI